MFEVNSESKKEVENTMIKETKKKFSIVSLIQVFVLLGLLGLSGFLYYEYTSLEDELDRYKDTSNAAQIEQERVQQTLDDVGLLMLLPDETPTVAVLTDLEGLKEENPSFYKNSVSGDILLIYTDKAILYRETDNMIINVAPVFIEPISEELVDIDIEEGNEVLGVENETVVNEEEI